MWIAAAWKIVLTLSSAETHKAPDDANYNTHFFQLASFIIVCLENLVSVFSPLSDR